MAWKMTDQVRRSYRSERRLAAASVDPGAAWAHLERAHVLAQPFVVAHVGSHVAMLRRGFAERDRTEVAGQVVRIVLAGPASAFGRIPTGNTGRARVPLSRVMPVPEDLAAVLGPD